MSVPDFSQFGERQFLDQICPKNINEKFFKKITLNLKQR